MNNKKSCFNCKHALVEDGSGPCQDCIAHSNWKIRKMLPQSPEIPDIFAWAPIQPIIYESAIRMYDRYMQVVLTSPQKKDSPEIMSMSQFVNHLIVRGLISYSEFLLPMEKELGII